MAQASRMTRKLRRIRRERTLAFRMIDLLTNQRDQARMIAGTLETELKKFTDNPFPEGEDLIPIMQSAQDLVTPTGTINLIAPEVSIARTGEFIE